MTYFKDRRRQKSAKMESSSTPEKRKTNRNLDQNSFERRQTRREILERI